MIIQIGIPFYQDFEAAKSGLRELKKVANQLDKWVFEYQGNIFYVEPRVGNFPKSDIKDSLVHSIEEVRENMIHNTVAPMDLFAWADSDINWHFKDLLKMIARKKDIVFAPFIGHANKDVYQCGLWKRPGIIKKRFPIGTKGFKKVDFTGFAFGVIAARVFENIDLPWFYRIPVTEKGKTVYLGEDYSFCMRAGQKYDIYVDFDIKVKHEKLKPVNWDI